MIIIFGDMIDMFIDNGALDQIPWDQLPYTQQEVMQDPDKMK